MNAARFANTDIDREQLAGIADQQGQLRRLAQHPDPQVRAKATQDLASLGTQLQGWLEDIESRREGMDDESMSAQRDIVRSAADDLRERETQRVATGETLLSSANQINSILNDADDVNSPLNRGRLMQLMNANSRAFLSDPDDLGDALSRAGGQGLISQVVGVAGGLISAEDFNFSREDWRKIATAMYDFQQNSSAREGERIAGETQLLDAASGRLQMFPQGYTLRNYVLGEESEIPPSPLRAEPYPDEQSATESGRSAVGDFLGQPDDPNAAERAESGEVFRPMEQPPAGMRRFNEALERLPVGAVARADPETGRVYATLADGETFEVDTGNMITGGPRVRNKILEMLRERRSRRGRGVITRD
jgi:hypothetical protein